MEFGSLNILIEYVDITCATVLINISLPAFEINFSFHPIALFVIFSWRFLKVLTLDFPVAIGSPRYLSYSVIILAPKSCLRDSLTSCFVFLLKNSVVFCRFMAWLDVASYCSSNCRSLCPSSIVAWQNKRLSSAKRRWETQTPCWLDLIPFSTPASPAFLNSADSPFAHSKKRYEERGSPCLIPMVGVTKPLGWPLIKME